MSRLLATELTWHHDHLGIKHLGVKCDESKEDIIIIMHMQKRQKRCCRLSTCFCQYIGLLGLHVWSLQGCQMSRSKKSWRQTVGHQMIYSQRRDNHHRAPRTPQHAEKVLQTQHPLLSIYWAQGRRKVRKSGVGGANINEGGLITPPWLI